MSRKKLFADAGERLKNTVAAQAEAQAVLPAAPPAPRTPSVMTAYNDRLDKIGTLAETPVQVVNVLAIDPALCRPWSGNGRMARSLTPANCQDLIDAMIADGGQKIPAIVRPLEHDPKYQYEIIAGVRRHFAISWLRGNNYPDFKYLVEVRRLDDEAAFRLSDQENRGRKDISDVERARNYRDAIEKYYGGSQQRLADRLRLSKGWLSRLLKLADLPDLIIDAYTDPALIPVKTGYLLSQLLSDPNKRDQVLEAARSVVAEQKDRLSFGHPVMTPDQVTKRLQESQVARKPRVRQVPVYASTGKPLLTVVKDTAQFMTLTIHAGSGASEDEVIARFREQLALARFNARKSEKTPKQSKA